MAILSSYLFKKFFSTAEDFNWKYFGNPKHFLREAFKNSYINKNTPEQIWANLISVAKNLKIKNAREIIEDYKNQLQFFDEKASCNDIPRYTGGSEFHNMLAPRAIAKIIYPILKPESIVDFGCNIGTFLSAFKEEGVKEVLGLDGEWIDTQNIQENILLDEFLCVDLEKSVSLDKKFDLAISLEVAEHLSPESADIFVESLTKASDTILFSAATPITWYDASYLNNQWPDYWSEKFKKHGFTMYDVIRPLLANNDDIFSWYRTNTFLIAKNKVDDKFKELIHSKKIFVQDFYPRLSKNGFDFKRK